MRALRDDALELVFAHGLPERLPILEWFRRVPAGTVQAEAVEDATTLAVRLRHDAIVLHAQHVERNEAERDRRVPVKDGPRRREGSPVYLRRRMRPARRRALRGRE